MRINTLIDDEPICEVDFNANHLRLNLAVLYKQDAGDAPYEDIGELSKVNDRTRVKQFITVAMGASDESKACKALNRDGFNAELFEQIKQGTLKRYPIQPFVICESKFCCQEYPTSPLTQRHQMLGLARQKLIALN